MGLREHITLKASIDQEGLPTKMEERYYLIIGIIFLESWGFWAGPWDKNTHLKLVQNISYGTYVSDCCICMHMPECVSKETGIDIIEIPFSDGRDWIKTITYLRNNPEKDDMPISVQIPVELPYNYSCVQRCMSRDTTGLNCSVEVTNTTNCAKNFTVRSIS